MSLMLFDDSEFETPNHQIDAANPPSTSLTLHATNHSQRRQMPLTGNNEQPDGSTLHGGDDHEAEAHTGESEGINEAPAGDEKSGRGIKLPPITSEDQDSEQTSSTSFSGELRRSFSRRSLLYSGSLARGLNDEAIAFESQVVIFCISQSISRIIVSKFDIVHCSRIHTDSHFPQI